MGKVEDDNYFRCDIGDYRQIETVIRYVKPDLVYNCTKSLVGGMENTFMKRFGKQMPVGTKNIIRLQEELGFKLVHTSTSEVYGDYQDVMYEDVDNGQQYIK